MKNLWGFISWRRLSSSTCRPAPVAKAHCERPPCDSVGGCRLKGPTVCKFHFRNVGILYIGILHRCTQRYTSITPVDQPSNKALSFSILMLTLTFSKASSTRVRACMHWGAAIGLAVCVQKQLDVFIISPFQSLQLHYVHSKRPSSQNKPKFVFRYGCPLLSATSESRVFRCLIASYLLTSAQTKKEKKCSGKWESSSI